jgi:hypothetical protein
MSPREIPVIKARSVETIDPVTGRKDVKIIVPLLKVQKAVAAHKKRLAENASQQNSNQ